MLVRGERIRAPRLFPMKHHPHFPRSGLVARLALAVILGFSAAWLAAAGTTVKVTVLSTTDLHGRVYPVDYYTGKAAEVGLAKIATLVQRERKDDPDLLLIDCGDTIQGTPMVYYHNRRHNEPTDPMMLAMNSLRYDAMVPGNHEYNFGLAVLQKARSEASFPWLSANTIAKSTGKPAYDPYLVKEVRGVRIGILGLTTPGIPRWEDPEHYAGLEFLETVGVAEKYVRILREQEHVDAVVVAMHMGIDGDPALVEPASPLRPAAENAALAIARQVPGIDLILMAHTHRTVSALSANGVLLTQAGYWGNHLVKAELFFAQEESGGWKLQAKSARAQPVHAGIPADEAILALIRPYHDEAQAWLDTKIGVSARALDAREGSLRDTALIDLIQRVQLETGQADVSLAANYNRSAFIPEGDVTVRDIAAIYVYENTLYVVEITGAQLKAALEHAAGFFLPYEPGRTPAQLMNPEIPAYNFDMAAGVSYEIDLRRAPGDRIRNLVFKGEPLAPGRKLRLAINNYRYNGGGGYTMLKGAPVLMRSGAEIRDLIIDWVTKNKTIPAEPDNNWRIVH